MSTGKRDASALIEYCAHRHKGEGIIAICIRSNNISLLEALLKGDVLPDEHEEYGISALSLAAQEGNVAAVSLLLAWGANVHGTAFEDASPLMHAIEHDKVSVAAVLLANGASAGYRPSREGDIPMSGSKSDRMSELLARFAGR